MTTAPAGLLLALTLAAGAETATLDVPFLPQTPALCGGAAAAMVFRYWGDRHADVQQFAPYVDERHGGIASDVLVAAIQERRWQAERISGSITELRARLAARQPVVLLLDDRPGRFHYVVAVGADPSHIYVHDPTWGPSRRYTDEDLANRWKPSNFWGVVVLPDERKGAVPLFHQSVQDTGVRPRCGVLLDEAIDEIARRGLSSADALLDGVRKQCPRSAGPIAELAAVRFAQRRLDEAESLASEAAAVDPSHEYAWDVLGSVRFLRDNPVGALSAWNHIGKPRLDSVVIDGLTRTRYALVAESLGLEPNRVLTAPAYRAAERRLRQLPSRVTSAIRYRPDEDGFATVNVVLVEPSMWPRRITDWAGAGARAAVNREVTATIPGWSGQGEAWTVSWRWWHDRPRAAIAFDAPRALGFRGITRVEASWEQQAYALDTNALTHETQLHGALLFTDWIAAGLRYEAGVGVDSWDHTRRTVSAGGVVEQSLLEDRVIISTSGRYWRPAQSGGPFRSGSLEGTVRSSTTLRGLVHRIDAGFQTASHTAPLAMWPGAGDGHARAPLLRAHPLLEDGVVTGSTFGRRLAYATAETSWWVQPTSMARMGAAAFLDVARATHGVASVQPRTHADVGAGFRIALLGDDGVLRADFAHGVRDGRNAFSLGWMATGRR